MIQEIDDVLSSLPRRRDGVKSRRTVTRALSRHGSTGFTSFAPPYYDARPLVVRSIAEIIHPRHVSRVVPITQQAALPKPRNILRTQSSARCSRSANPPRSRTMLRAHPSTRRSRSLPFSPSSNANAHRKSARSPRHSSSHVSSRLNGSHDLVTRDVKQYDEQLGVLGLATAVSSYQSNHISRAHFGIVNLEMASENSRCSDGSNSRLHSRFVFLKFLYRTLVSSFNEVLL